MNSIKKLINKETCLYLVFGVLTTLVDFLAYIGFRECSVNFMIANVLSWSIAVIFAFITNKIYVFNSKSIKLQTIKDEFLSFVGARVFSLFFSLVFIYFMVTLLGTNDLIAKVLSSIFVIIINYVLSKFYIFNQDTSKKRSFSAFLYDNISIIIAFLVPLIILIIVYYMRDIYPFGYNMYLRSDCYHQYAPFHKEFYDKITSGGNLTYSWNIGLGVNFSALYAYYLASPFNWLIGLVSPNHILEIMSVFIVVKTALCGFTFAFYLSKHFHTKKLTIATLSVFYALSSYFCAFSWNLMWLDCLFLLPIIILGLERLVKENKCYLYCISLGFAILSNYYIAIMICIFCVLYYFVMLYIDEAKKDFAYYKMRFKNFALFSLLAGGFAAITVLPAYYALSSTASGEFEFPKTIITYFSVMDMLSRSLINVDAAIFSAHDPNLYCTVAVFLLVPLFALNPKIKFRDKVAKLSLLAFMLISFNTNFLNYIWHGFHYPNSLPCRESFLYIFLILAISYEALINIREITRKQLAATFTGAIALILLIEKLYVKQDYSSLIIYVSIIFLLFYLVVITLFRSNKYKQNFVAYLLLVIVAAEAFINTEETGIGTCTRSLYLNDNKPIENLIDAAKKSDDSFYRTEKYDRRTKNDAAWHNYYGASTFSSTASAGLSKYYGSLGFEESTNAYAYYGHTPLTEAMFSIKYVISNNFLAENDFITQFAQSENYYLYKNNYTLPLAFMMPGNVITDWNNSDPNPFEVQNNLVNTLIPNSDKMYTRLMVDTLGTDNSISVRTDLHLFIYVTTSLDAVTISITDNTGKITSKNYNSMTHMHILDLGNIAAGSKVTISPADNKVSSIQLYAYQFDESVFKNAFNKLNETTMELETFKETYLKGSIDVKENGMLYTSIPYDKGWSVYVDGKKVKTISFKKALLAINLDSGHHTIEFKYKPVGFTKGILITSLSVIVFLAIVIADYMKKKRAGTISIENENPVQ